MAGGRPSKYTRRTFFKLLGIAPLVASAVLVVTEVKRSPGNNFLTKKEFEALIKKTMEGSFNGRR